MTPYLALSLSLILASSTVLAALPSMPAAAAPMTTRDDCFQRLRGHEERWAQQHGYQIQALIAAYAGDAADGDFACSGRFEVTDDQGQVALGPRRLYVLLRN
nr:hypothetical protein [uncultured Pseudomonas sp.]